MKKLEKEDYCFITEFDPSTKIDDCCDEASSSDMRLISSVQKLEKEDDCFILEFNSYHEIDISKLSLSNTSCELADLSVIGENGKVACRDYPHSRHNCAKYPFEKTPHDNHCNLCFCYVCDSDAPCPMWLGSSGHCHAFDTESWNEKRKYRKLKMASGDYPHYRHNCVIYAFDKTPHDSHCKQCYCYVCDMAAPCHEWVRSSGSGHCHASKSEKWDKRKRKRRN